MVSLDIGYMDIYGCPMDRDRYLEIATTYTHNTNYLIYFQDKTSI